MMIRDMLTTVIIIATIVVVNLSSFIIIRNTVDTYKYQTSLTTVSKLLYDGVESVDSDGIQFRDYRLSFDANGGVFLEDKLGVKTVLGGVENYTLMRVNQVDFWTDGAVEDYDVSNLYQLTFNDREDVMLFVW